jgi:hypothetical protein
MIIERWHSHFHSPHPLSAEWLNDWHAGLERIDEDALLQGLVGDDEWLLINRLSLQTATRLHDVFPAASLQTALRQTLKQALDDPNQAQVVRYSHRRHAWADLLYRVALGDCSRTWAWVQLQMLPPQLARAESPESVLTAAVARLAKEAELIWPVLRQLLAAEAERASFTALLRALPSSGWRVLLAQAPQVAPYLAVASADEASGNPWQTLEDTDAAANANATATPTWSSQAASDRPGLDALLQWITRQSWLVKRHADTVAPLLAALSWPTAGIRPALLAERVQRAWTFCTAAASRQALPTARSPARPMTPVSLADEASESATVSSAATDDTPARLPTPATLPDSRELIATEWAGSLFWLGRIANCGVLDWLQTQPSASALPMWLGTLADCLGVTPNDPVRRVLLCDDLNDPIPAALAEHACALCAKWDWWLNEAAPDLPPPRLTRVCQRPGRLLREPGWVELVLPLDSVDTRIRRLGLDLDPGWLPWLGCMLKIRYE